MITKHIAAALAVLLACGFTSAARAEGPGYSFVDINYSRIVPQDVPGLQDGTGLEVNGSYSLPAAFTLTAAVSRDTYDIQGAPSSVYEVSQETSVGLGYHYPLTSRIDLVADLDYFGGRTWIETPSVTGPSVVSHGPAYGLGLRAMATDDLELHGFISKSHINGSDVDSHGLSAGFIYQVAAAVGLGLSYHHDTVDASVVHAGRTSYTSHATVLFVRFEF
jgi:hypothetical protein